MPGNKDIDKIIKANRGITIDWLIVTLENRPASEPLFDTRGAQAS